MIYKLFRSNEFDLSFDKNDLANIKTVYGRVGYENRLLKEKEKDQKSIFGFHYVRACLFTVKFKEESNYTAVLHYDFKFPLYSWLYASIFIAACLFTYSRSGIVYSIEVVFHTPCINRG